MSSRLKNEDFREKKRDKRIETLDGVRQQNKRWTDNTSLQKLLTSRNIISKVSESEIRKETSK